MSKLTEAQRLGLLKLRYAYETKIGIFQHPGWGRDDYDKGVHYDVTGVRDLSGSMSRATLKSLLKKGFVKAVRANYWEYDARRSAPHVQLNRDPSLSKNITYVVLKGTAKAEEYFEGFRGDRRVCDRILCDNFAVDGLGPGNWCSKTCMESQRSYDG